MKTLLALSLIGFAMCGMAQVQPPFNPISNTNSIPTNAIICRSELLTAEANARVRAGIVSVAGYFTLDWCYSNSPDSIPKGTITYALIVSGPISSTATFHIYSNCRREAVKVFDLDLAGTLNVVGTQIDDILSGRWWLIITDSGTPTSHLAARIALPDSDGDGVPDEIDECPGTVARAAVDSNGCSVAQLIPCDGPWHNHAEYLRAIKAEAARFLREGFITSVEYRDILREANASACGHP